MKNNNLLKDCVNEVVYLLLNKVIDEVKINTSINNNFILNQTLYDFYKQKIDYLMSINDDYEKLNNQIKSKSISKLLNKNKLIYNKKILKGDDIEENILLINDNLDSIYNLIKQKQGVFNE